MTLLIEDDSATVILQFVYRTTCFTSRETRRLPPEMEQLPFGSHHPKKRDL